MGTCAACLTYGAAAGVDVLVGVTCITGTSRRRVRPGAGLGLGAVALTAAATTGLLCPVHDGEGHGHASAADQALALTTASAFLPLAWFVVVAWSHQEDDARLGVATFHLVVAVLFAINRYDALVATGTLDTLFLQPLAFPAVAVVLGLRQQVRRRNQLARHRASAARDERQRIARELHDSVTQTLYSVAMAADAFPALADHDPAAARHQAGRIRSMTLDALGDLRVLLLEMREPAASGTGTGTGTGTLGTLLQSLADAEGDQVRAEIDAGSGPGPPAPVRFAAYRIADQAVTNARRHAGASAIVVRLRQVAGSTVVTVADDGAGFDPRSVPPGRHGLQIMRERAASVGGELRVDSAPGRGTVVRFGWPAPAVAAAVAAAAPAVTAPARGARR